MDWLLGELQYIQKMSRVKYKSSYLYRIHVSSAGNLTNNKKSKKHCLDNS